MMVFGYHGIALGIWGIPAVMLVLAVFSAYVAWDNRNG